MQQIIKGIYNKKSISLGLELNIIYDQFNAFKHYKDTIIIWSIVNRYSENDH